MVKKFFSGLQTWSVIMRTSVFSLQKMALPPLGIEQITIESGVNDGLSPALAQSLSRHQSYGTQSQLKQDTRQPGHYQNNLGRVGFGMVRVK